ncbi:hypothetical protein PO903_01415 [Paenibacillus sp. PK4536]|uniref:hypothetical protein n=1 Tax=Paenibacillus sp. PK4536 TaxID=3024576 RepID=UPI00235A3F5A|nr:hypothetical protein [Paenibacillus sp. PK4536]WIM39579.1 hypothetical protein PO903_01415 [Paenibacillus sp. PK4536]
MSVTRSKAVRIRLWIICILSGIIALLIIGAGTLYWIAAPERPLNLEYTDVDTTAKIISMVETKKLETTISQDEFNQLAKQELLDRQHEFPLGLKLTGAQFTLHNQNVTADLRGTYWGIPFGALLDFHIKREENRLVLDHQATHVRHGDFSGAWIEPITISLTKYFPAIVNVNQMEFAQDHIQVSFKLNLLSLPKLLLR